MRFSTMIVALCAAGTIFASSDAICAEPTSTYDPDRIADFSVGIFCPPEKSHKTEAHDTIPGEISRYEDSPVPVRKTQTVPAIDGISFGIEGRESQASPADVTIVVDHPAMGSDLVTSESWTTQMEAQRITFHGYFLGLSDGNPNGRWTITGVRDGQVLFRTEFDVVSVKTLDSSQENPCLTMLLS